METYTEEQKQSEQERKNKLSVEVSDILNQFLEIGDFKNKLSPILFEPIEVFVNTPVKVFNKQDWEFEINKALQTGSFSSQCSKQSRSWGSCAFGARLQIECPDIAKEINESSDNGARVLEQKHVPLTRDVISLGQKFHGAICDNKPKEAQKIFNKIQSLDSIFTYDQRNFQK